MTLHCGACSKLFDDAGMLIEHIQECAAAKEILLPVTALMCNPKLDKDHSAVNLIWRISNNRSYIEDYAHAISIDMPSFDRSNIHRRLCHRLGLDYSTFRPFESTKITEIPTKEEAMDILYVAIGEVLREKVFGDNHE